MVCRVGLLPEAKSAAAETCAQQYAILSIYTCYYTRKTNDRIFIAFYLIIVYRRVAAKAQVALAAVGNYIFLCVLNHKYS